MVIGKLKYWIAPRPEHTFPLSLNVVLMRHMRVQEGARRAWILVVEVGDPDPQPGKKGEMLHV